MDAWSASSSASRARCPTSDKAWMPKEAWITAFGVHPDYQGRGIGSALFTHILDKMRGEGRENVDISPYVPNYFRARNRYRSLSRHDQFL